MREPIVVSENGDINIFDSWAAARTSMEPADVRNNEYMVFDADGCRLSLTIETRRRRVFGVFSVALEEVVLESVDEDPRHRETLSLLLRGYLKNIGCAIPGGQDLPLEDLLSEVARYLRG